MASGDDASPPVPWGALLVVGVLVGTLVVLADGAAAPKRSAFRANKRRKRTMRTNAGRRVRRKLTEPATLVVRRSGKVVLAQAADWAYGAMQWTPYDSMEAFRDEWDVQTVHTEPAASHEGFTSRYPDAVTLLSLRGYKGRGRA
jgi:hypothetical protein